MTFPLKVRFPVGVMSVAGAAGAPDMPLMLNDFAPGFVVGAGMNVTLLTVVGAVETLVCVTLKLPPLNSILVTGCNGEAVLSVVENGSPDPDTIAFPPTYPGRHQR